MDEDLRDHVWSLQPIFAVGPYPFSHIFRDDMKQWRHVETIGTLHPKSQIPEAKSAKHAERVRSRARGCVEQRITSLGS